MWITWLVNTGSWCGVQMTGRKGRVVSTKDGVQYESRSEVDVRLEILNLTEKQRFMDGDKVCLSTFSLCARLLQCQILPCHCLLSALPLY